MDQVTVVAPATTQLPRWILLDRDGVINHDSPDYVRSADEWQPLPGSIEAMAMLYRHHHRLLVITNQSGVGRGYYPRQELFAMHRKLSQLLAAAGAQVEAVYYCPHLPADQCDCRKPLPGMIRRAMDCFHFSADQALMVGDSARDLAAANAAGVAAVRVGPEGEYPSLVSWVSRLLGDPQ